MEEKMKELMESEGFVEKMLSCEEPEQVQALFAENGVEMSLEDVKSIGAALEQMYSGEGELDEDALENVAGGSAAQVVVALAKGAVTIGKAVVRNWSSVRRWFRRW